MKFNFTDGYIKCSTCGFFFTQEIPQEKAFLLQCPECGEKGTYLVEWFVNEIEDDELEPVL